MLFIYFNRPDRFAVLYYENYAEQEIFENLLRKTASNSTNVDAGIKCDYTELLEENHFFYKKFTTDDVINKNEILIGGKI